MSIFGAVKYYARRFSKLRIYYACMELMVRNNGEFPIKHLSYSDIYLSLQNKDKGDMKTRDEILKMRACLLYVLRQLGKETDFIKLFKVLYFAQREHLVKYGRGVIGDTFHALRFGPVPSFIYKALQMAQGKQEKDPDFVPFLEGIEVSDASLVSSAVGPDMDELSLSDIACLDKYIEKYKDLDSYKLSNRSQYDKAWKEAFSRSKDDPEKDVMTVLDIAKAGKAKSGVIAYIKENILVDKYCS